MDPSDIDISKENIQPLKEGRLTSYLGTALNNQCNGNQSDLMMEREKFELEIRKYKGNDPLGVWYSYICWVIQSYPNNDLGHCTTLLRNCLSTFKDDERYHQDVRYVKLWIKYIQTQNDPMETFEMVHKHGIGNVCTEYYKSWADGFEAAGDFKSAASVYAKGFSCGAQPVAELACHQRNFEERVARRLVTRTDEDGLMNSDAGNEKRQVLSALSMTTERGMKQGTVGTLRTGAAISGSAGVLKQSNHSRWEQKPLQFQIFSDQGTAESGSRVKLENIPSVAVTNRENTMKPGKWTHGHVSSSKRHTAFSSAIPFKVHEDHLSGQGIATPGGASYSENVFKVRKLEKDDYDCPLAIFEPPDPTKIPMYCKDKVYSGGVEFSLEEIRAIRYFEAEKRRVGELTEKKDNCDKQFDVESEEAISAGKSPQSNYENVPPKEWLPNQNNENAATPKVVKWHGIQEQGPRRRGSPVHQMDLLSASSPTMNTRAANAMMNELFSATFLGDSMLVMPQNPQPEAPKFDIPCDETTAFLGVPKERTFIPPITETPKFAIHCDENVLFQETPLGDKEFSERDQNWGANIPYVVPPQDEKDEEDNTKENQCPDAYHQTTTQKNWRPLAGVLVPSKNIPFQPLEENEDGSEQPAHKKSEDKPSESSCGAPLDSSFERELMSALNDETTFDIPMRVTLSEDIAFGSVGGALLKKHTLINNVETEIEGDPEDCAPREFFKARVTNSVQFVSSNAKVALYDGNTRVAETSASQSDGETLLSEAVEIVEDPTSPSRLDDLIGKVAVPVGRSSNFYRIAQIRPELKTNDELNLREGLKLKILKVMSNSVDTKIFLAVKSDGDPIVIKCEVVSCEWEFYIIREIRSRLGNVRMYTSRIPRESYLECSAFVNIREGYLFNGDRSMLLMEHLPNGTFLDLLNLFKRKRLIFPEILTLYFTIDMINTVRHLHGCNIIHGAIRPDNLLIGEIPDPPAVWNEECFSGLLPVLQLANFGKCIDMVLFPGNVRFMSSISSHDPYQCVEMQNGRPWTYQADLYSIAFTIHCMIFGEFMDVFYFNEVCSIKRKIPSRFKSNIWNTLFSSLLNVPSCDNIPDLLLLQNKLQGCLLTFKLEEFASAVATMRMILAERKK